MSSNQLPQTNSMAAASTTSLAAQYVVGGILCALVLGLTANLSMPWESDQPAKAAQILEIANRHDYWLSSDVPRCYRLKTFAVYYTLSGLLYSVTGGDIFAFMNLSSVVMGVVAALATAWAFYNTLRIAPIWTLLALLCMPLFVITNSYGNEAAWSMAFFSLSLALVSTRRVSLHYAGGASVAMSLFCRPDVLFLAPYWFAWTLLFCKTDKQESWIVRLLRPSAAFVGTAITLFILLVREIPPNEGAFDLGFNIKLIAAYLTYPFNPSLVLVGAVGWLILCRKQPAYAWAHLLLLVPVAYYIRNLSSPKYVICLLLFYGLPAAYLLNRVVNSLRLAIAACVAVWFVVGVSIYGVFGPAAAAIWYVPTADGPCPIGGYTAFYTRAHSGFYQIKQVEHINQARDFVEFARNSDGRYWIAGHWLVQPIHLLRAQGEIDAAAQVRIEQITSAPGSQGGVQPNDGSRTLLFRSAYLDLGSLQPDLAATIRSFIEKGKLRPVGPGAGHPLPTLIEVGDHVPDGENRTLGERILFAIDLYEGHMIFELPEFIKDYRATSWVSTASPASVEPLYRDEQISVYDEPIADAKVFSFAWPARYYQMKSPVAKFKGRLAK